MIWWSYFNLHVFFESTLFHYANPCRNLDLCQVSEKERMQWKKIKLTLAEEWVGDLKLKRIKILNLPADTVVQLVECLSDNLMAWIWTLQSVRFFICSIVFFIPCYPGKTLEGPNYHRGLHNLIMLIKKRHENKNTIYIHIYVYLTNMILRHNTNK